MSRSAGSTAIERSLGGNALWSQASRGQVRHEVPMRVTASSLRRLRPSA